MLPYPGTIIGEYHLYFKTIMQEIHGLVFLFGPLSILTFGISSVFIFGSIKRGKINIWAIKYLFISVAAVHCLSTFGMMFLVVWGLTSRHI